MAFAAAIGAIASVVSAGVGAFAAFQQAAVHRMNAQIERENAVRRIELAQQQQEEQDIQSRALLGEQLTQQAASGVAVERGSPKFTRIAGRELARLDALNVRQAGEIDAFNHRVAAVNHEAQAKISKTQGIGSLLGGFLSAGSKITSARSKADKNYFANPVPRTRILV